MSATFANVNVVQQIKTQLLRMIFKGQEREANHLLDTALVVLEHLGHLLFDVLASP